MTEITDAPALSSVSEAPDRQTANDQTEFDGVANTFLTSVKNFGDSLPPWAAWVKNIATLIQGWATTASNAATVAQAAANYQGDHDPERSYTVGQSVSDGDDTWQAKRSVAPGAALVEGADWTLRPKQITLAQAHANALSF